MTDRQDSTEMPRTAASEPKSRYRLSGRRQRAAEELAEPVSPVTRPSTLVFDASPTTVAASLRRTGNAGLEATLSWPPAAEAGEAGQEPPVAEAVTPVFVIGGGKAERELLRALFDAHPGLCCGSDGQLLADMAAAVEESWETTLVYLGYPEQYWFSYVAKHFESIQAGKAAARQRDRWVEFIPDGALSVGTLDRMFPRSRIVHLVSTGWSSQRSQRIVRTSVARISAGRYFEVRTGELNADPEGALRSILGFLGEEPQPPLDAA